MNRHIPLEALPEIILVDHWRDPLVETHGHHILDAYVETWWLPVLGPAASWVLRRLRLAIDPEGPVQVDTATLASSIGLGAALGANAPLAKSVHRLLMFGAARRDGDSLWIRTHLGDVPAAYRRNWPDALIVDHAGAHAAR